MPAIVIAAVPNCLSPSVTASAAAYSDRPAQSRSGAQVVRVFRRTQLRVRRRARYNVCVRLRRLVLRCAGRRASRTKDKGGAVTNFSRHSGKQNRLLLTGCSQTVQVVGRGDRHATRSSQAPNRRFMNSIFGRRARGRNWRGIEMERVAESDAADVAVAAEVTQH